MEVVGWGLSSLKRSVIGVIFLSLSDFESSFIIARDQTHHDGVYHSLELLNLYKNRILNIVPF
jgi:hypothetical protein